MVQFQGDLLVGGDALRNVDGTITSQDAGGIKWRGHFSVANEQSPLLKLDRPYLLMLADGRSGRVVITEWNEVEQGQLRVEFEAAE